MKTIILPAGLSSDLDWSLQKEEARNCCDPILWELDFAFSASRDRSEITFTVSKGKFGLSLDDFSLEVCGAMPPAEKSSRSEPLFTSQTVKFIPERSLSDQAAFNSYILALDQFGIQIWKEFASRSKGVVLYRGSLAILKNTEDEVESANIFGDLLHRLASFLPDEATTYCLFEESPYGKARTAQLLSKERFLHLHLSMEDNRSPRGILLPSDEACTPEILAKLEILMEKVGPHRMIPETRLNEMWDGLDEIYVIEEAISLQGYRHVKGFIAAGGLLRLG